MGRITFTESDARNLLSIIKKTIPVLEGNGGATEKNRARLLRSYCRKIQKKLNNNEKKGVLL